MIPKTPNFTSYNPSFIIMNSNLFDERIKLEGSEFIVTLSQAILPAIILPLTH